MTDILRGSDTNIPDFANTPEKVRWWEVLTNLFYKSYIFDATKLRQDYQLLYPDEDVPSVDFIKKFVQHQRTYQIHKIQPVPPAQCLPHFRADSFGQYFQIDLIYIDDIFEYPWKYAVCLIDVYSRCAFGRLLKNRTSKDTAVAFQDIVTNDFPKLVDSLVAKYFKTTPNQENVTRDMYRAKATEFREKFIKMEVLRSDQGGEFMGEFETTFRNLFAQGVLHALPYRGHHAMNTEANDHFRMSIVERFNYTIKGLCMRYKTANNLKRIPRETAPQIFQSLIDSYNDTSHSALRTKVFREREPGHPRNQSNERAVGPPITPLQQILMESPIPIPWQAGEGDMNSDDKTENLNEFMTEDGCKDKPNILKKGLRVRIQINDERKSGTGSSRRRGWMPQFTSSIYEIVQHQYANRYLVRKVENNNNSDPEERSVRRYDIFVLPEGGEGPLDKPGIQGKFDGKIAQSADNVMNVVREVENLVRNRNKTSEEIANDVQHIIDDSLGAQESGPRTRRERQNQSSEEEPFVWESASDKDENNVHFGTFIVWLIWKRGTLNVDDLYQQMMDTIEPIYTVTKAKTWFDRSLDLLDALDFILVDDVMIRPSKYTKELTGRQELVNVSKTQELAVIRVILMDRFASSKVKRTSIYYRWAAVLMKLIFDYQTTETNDPAVSMTNIQHLFTKHKKDIQKYLKWSEQDAILFKIYVALRLLSRMKWLETGTGFIEGLRVNTWKIPKRIIKAWGKKPESEMTFSKIYGRIQSEL